MLSYVFSNESSTRAKPFMTLFFLSYILCIPASLSCYLGFGRASSLGAPIGPIGSQSGGLSITDVIAQSGSLRPGKDYMNTIDGFIAFNLSKSVVHTLTPYDLGPSDSLYYGNTNPVLEEIFGESNSSYSDLYVSEVSLFDSSSKSEHEDVQSRWTVAPIFATSSECIQEYAPVHITCMLSNKILAWAVATDAGSLCRLVQSASCNSEGRHDTRLSIYYPERFDEKTPSTIGVSGMVSASPPDFIVEAIKRRFVADGWPIEADSVAYPQGMPSIWIQVSPSLEKDIEEAKIHFTVFEYISIVLMVVTALLMIVPFVLDVQTDLLVRKLIERQKEVLRLNSIEAMKRAQRRRQVDELTKLNFD